MATQMKKEPNRVEDTQPHLYIDAKYPRPLHPRFKAKYQIGMKSFAAAEQIAPEQEWDTTNPQEKVSTFHPMLKVISSAWIVVVTLYTCLLVYDYAFRSEYGGKYGDYATAYTGDEYRFVNATKLDLVQFVASGDFALRDISTSNKGYKTAVKTQSTIALEGFNYIVQLGAGDSYDLKVVDAPSEGIRGLYHGEDVVFKLDKSLVPRLWSIFLYVVIGGIVALIGFFAWPPIIEGGISLLRTARRTNPQVLKQTSRSN